jgi:uncharacterized zinc-type alcohol dehydrogenase-like protein
MAAYAERQSLRPIDFQRRALGPKDVAIQILYCGVCHSDIHTAHGDWGNQPYPLVLGHEISGKVIAVGPSVSKFIANDRVAVGVMVNSCRHCAECRRGAENYCENGFTNVYSSKDRDGSITQGGYSTFIVVDEDFVLRVPAALDLAEAAPLLCAGITTYSPLRHWSIAPESKVAVVGFGGLGHIAVQFASKMGAEVTVLTTSPDKEADARRLGAKSVTVYRDGSSFPDHKRTFDFILDTVPYQHDLDSLIPTLRRDGTLCRVGVGKLTTPNQFSQMANIPARTSITSSLVGGLRETQEMLDLCAVQNIRPQITKIPLSGINDAWSKVVAKQVRYRFVLDMTSEA